MKTGKALIATLTLAAALADGRQLAAQPNQPPPAPEAGAEGTPPPITNDFTPDQQPPPANPVDDQVAAVVPEVFHDTLATDGRWTESSVYGQVWVPKVPAGWRPYTTGHWADTDQGWAWMGDESWAWATFHYGRWYYDTGLGWAWVPGAVWAPAWVAWRDGGGYLGWAPLPPSVGFSGDTGLDATSAISPSFFTFVDEKNFQAPRVAAFIVSTARNAEIARVAEDVTRYAVLNNSVVTLGVSPQRIAQVTGQPVVPIKVGAGASPGSGAGKGAFYQPPALSRVAQTSHHEFGAALPHQVAMQRHGPLANSSSVATGARPAGSGRRSPITPGAQGARPTQAGAQAKSQPVTPGAQGARPTQGGAQPKSQPVTPGARGAHPTQGGTQAKSQPVTPRPPQLQRAPPPKARDQATKERKPPP
jgi:hypothetical protein